MLIKLSFEVERQLEEAEPDMDHCSESSESSLEQEDLRESTRNLNPTVGTVHRAIAQNITSASHKRASLGDCRESAEYL